MVGVLYCRNESSNYQDEETQEAANWEDPFDSSGLKKLHKNKYYFQKRASYKGSIILQFSQLLSKAIAEPIKENKGFHK